MLLFVPALMLLLSTAVSCGKPSPLTALGPSIEKLEEQSRKLRIALGSLPDPSATEEIPDQGKALLPDVRSLATLVDETINQLESLQLHRTDAGRADALRYALGSFEQMLADLEAVLGDTAAGRSDKNEALAAGAGVAAASLLNSRNHLEDVPGLDCREMLHLADLVEKSAGQEVRPGAELTTSEDEPPPPGAEVLSRAKLALLEFLGAVHRHRYDEAAGFVQEDERRQAMMDHAIVNELGMINRFEILDFNELYHRSRGVFLYEGVVNMVGTDGQERQAYYQLEEVDGRFMVTSCRFNFEY